MSDLHGWQTGVLDLISGSAGAAGGDGVVESFDNPDRLEVYRNNLLFGLIDVLTAKYEVTAEFIGHDGFRAFARDYVRGHPQTSGDRNQYGGRFPAFLKTHDQIRDMPYLADLASLEWAMQFAHHAADTQVLGFEGLLNDHPVRLHPSAQVIDVGARVFDLYQAHFSQSCDGFELVYGPQTYLIWRDHKDEVLCAGLSDLEQRFVRRVSRGVRLVEVVSEFPESAMNDLQVFLAGTVGSGLFVDGSL